MAATKTETNDARPFWKRALKPSRPKKGRLDFEPSDHFLTVNLSADRLPNAAQAEFAEYLRRCESLEQDIADLFDRRATLCTQAPDVLWGELLEAAEELRNEFVQLADERNGLIAEKIAICRKLKDEMRAVVDADREALAAAIKAERDRLSALGIDEYAMPHAAAAPDVVERQFFREKIAMSDGVLAASAKLNRSRGQLEGLRAVAKSAPTIEELRWPMLSGDAAKVARAIDLASEPRPHYPLRLNGGQ